jgi:hypothetical protein
MGTFPFKPHVSRDEVAKAAGTRFSGIQSLGDEGMPNSLLPNTLWLFSIK